MNPEFERFPFVVRGTRRFHVVTDRGDYLDFSGSGMTVGYDFLDRRDLVSPVSSLVFENDTTRRLTAKLRRISGFDRVAYTSSGTEACDMALSRYGPPLAALEGSYHGRTFLAFRSSNGVGIDSENRIVHLSMPENARANSRVFDSNLELLKRADGLFDLKGSPIIIELVQSDGGMRILEDDFLEHIKEVIDRFGLKLIIDEVYTGMGRSGELLLFKKLKLAPDMVVMGKGMAAGLPMGAILYSGGWDLPYGSALGMQGGNALCSHAALKTLAALTGKRLNFVRKEGLNIISTLKEADTRMNAEVRGVGFMIGVEFKDRKGRPSSRIAREARNRLLARKVVCGLVGQHNNVLKITPPVLIDHETLWKGISAIEEVLSDGA